MTPPQKKKNKNKKKIKRFDQFLEKFREIAFLDIMYIGLVILMSVV